MFYQSMFPRDLFTEMAQLQQQLDQLFDTEPSIRGIGRGGFPAMNIGTTPEAMEFYVFMPGMDPSTIELNVEHGVLTVAGERAETLSTQHEQATVHLNERFAGRFKRTVSLPEEIDPDGVNAQYRDGVLRITAKRRQATPPRRISVH